MFCLVVSESLIVARAIAQSLDGAFEEIRHFSRLPDIGSDVEASGSVLIFDLNRAEDDIPALLRFAKQGADRRVVVLTKDSHEPGKLEPLVGHVSAILPSSSEPDEIALVAQVVRSGLVLLPSKMLPMLRTPKVRLAERSNGAPLTEREEDVLALMAEAASNKVIARRLSINDATVRVHVRSVLRKLGVNNRTQAALLVMQNAAKPKNLAA